MGKPSPYKGHCEFKAGQPKEILQAHLLLLEVSCSGRLQPRLVDLNVHHVS